ncbi:MAG: hypothetical protein CM15mP77_4380 [Synechococcus sp.]|nr:MAG: hypothetical protein CM15mP77_4380 [Synechococcus sp.]
MGEVGGVPSGRIHPYPPGFFDQPTPGPSLPIPGGFGVIFRALRLRVDGCIWGRVRGGGSPRAPERPGVSRSCQRGQRFFWVRLPVAGSSPRSSRLASARGFGEFKNPPVP